MEYARWLDEHQRHITDLRSALNSQMGDDDLRVLVDAVMMHYDEMFMLKSMGTKSDAFHILSGMWTSPTERFFMWLGGFRSSELLKVPTGICCYICPYPSINLHSYSALRCPCSASFCP
jgi:transcription factor TGA